MRLKERGDTNFQLEGEVNSRDHNFSGDFKSWIQEGTDLLLIIDEAPDYTVISFWLYGYK